MAKRNCRRTEEEAAIHKRAVELRKMTDAKLVQHVEDKIEKARSEGFERGKKAFKDSMGDHDITIKNFIQAIGLLPGIGKVTMEKINGLAEEGGWIEQGCKRGEKRKGKKSKVQDAVSQEPQSGGNPRGTMEHS